MQQASALRTEITVLQGQHVIGYGYTLVDQTFDTQTSLFDLAGRPMSTGQYDVIYQCDNILVVVPNLVQ